MTNVDCWTPGRILDHLKRGWILPPDWEQRLTGAGYEVTWHEPNLLGERTVSVGWVGRSTEVDQ